MAGRGKAALTSNTTRDDVRAGSCLHDCSCRCHDRRSCWNLRNVDRRHGGDGHRRQRNGRQHRCLCYHSWYNGAVSCLVGLHDLRGGTSQCQACREVAQAVHRSSL